MTAARKADHDPFLWQVIGLVIVFSVSLPTIIALTLAIEPDPPAVTPHPWAEVAMRIDADPDQILLGESTYINGCALCHGPNADGVARLGKPLRNSAYVQEHSDQELFQLIATGRPPADPENTTGAMMPARANQNLSNERLRAVITFLRAIQEPGVATASIEDWIIDTGGAQLAGVMGGVGHDLFISSCSACHGSTGEGMEGLGKPLADSPFIEAKTDKELITFIKMGRPIWDAENTTGVDMPPKGGNPALSEEQLSDIVKYIRTLHAKPTGG